MLVLNAQTAERDAAMVELTACLEVLREDKDRALAALAEARAALAARAFGQEAVAELDKVELLDLVADMDTRLQAALAEVWEIRGVG